MHNIEMLVPEGERWQAYVSHMKRMKMRYFAEPGVVSFAIPVEDQIIAHIAIQMQPLAVPASPLTDGESLPLTSPDGHALTEAFVNSFAVEADYRRKGYGRALQQTAIDHARERGCCQLRSWSSADRRENYALKLAMGFAVHPALYPMPGSDAISGVYFIMRL